MRLENESRELLRNELFELGFDEARFTNLEPISHTRLNEWVDLGYHADMEWLRNSIEKRKNPELVLEGACSAIMLGVNYLPSEKERAFSQERWGKYSLYIDYHDTVLKGLKAAGELLQEKYDLGPRDYRFYVDTGPVMERGWSAASGMGWQGKNGMLISKTHGNWLLLATILVKLDIEPDPPLRKKDVALDAGKRTELALLCGKCSRCMDACPTNAIAQPGMVNANLCISYQTIENKAIIPRELRPAIGGRIFGCDICLDVCPWNRFAKEGRQMLLSTRYHVVDLSLLDILKMDMETFRETFRKMPVKRLKLRGLLRNGCIVAGNLLENDEWEPDELTAAGRAAFLKEVAASLIVLASHEESMVRAHAVWALFRLLGKDEASRILDTPRLHESNDAVLEEYSYWVAC